MASANADELDHNKAPKDMTKQSDSDGQFRRQDAQFRHFVSPDPSAEFRAEKDRYVLYLNWGCPWAHRTNLVRSLKGLEDVIQLVVMGFELTEKGWLFDGKEGTDPKDPLYGFTEIRQLYWKADPNYKLRYTVPVLWDKKKETIVSNESSEIIRMFYSSFDALLPEHLRETSKAGGGLFPPSLRAEIEEMNGWVYNTVNNGVYKTGFASTQEAYDEHVYLLFKSLDRLEEHLKQPGHQPFLFGQQVTEADIRLFPTLIRFDTAYHTLFRCNLKMIRTDYPHLYKWLRTLYWDDSDVTRGAFRKTTYFDIFKIGYAHTQKLAMRPVGPVPHIHTLDEEIPILVK